MLGSNMHLEGIHITVVRGCWACTNRSLMASNRAVKLQEQWFQQKEQRYSARIVKYEVEEVCKIFVEKRLEGT